jgi:hypothetical protein
MDLEKYDKAFDKTINTVNSVYSVGRRIGYVLMAIVFLIAGLGLTGWGYVTVKNKLDGTSFVKTEGTVLKMREVPSNENSGVTWAPVIKFKDNAGNEHMMESSVSSDPPAYKIGDKVPLLYPEGKPKEAFIDSFMEKWFTPIMLGVAGVVMFIVSIWMVFSAFRRSKPSASYSDSSDGGSSYVSMG